MKYLVKSEILSTKSESANTQIFDLIVFARILVGETISNTKLPKLKMVFRTLEF